MMALWAIVVLGPGLYGVLVCRGLLGLCGGAVTVAAMTALVLEVPHAQHAWAQGGWGITTLLGPSWLAYLCGQASDTYGWRMAAGWQVVFALLAMLCLHKTLGARKPKFVPGQRADALGLLAWGTFVVAGQFVIARGTRYNWTDTPLIMPLVVLAATALALVVAWHRPGRKGAKFIDTTALGRPEFRFACLTGVASSYGSTARAPLLPLYARSLFGFASADVGALQLEAVLCTALGLLFSAAATARRCFIRLCCSSTSV